jgi:cytidine deaminase
MCYQTLIDAAIEVAAHSYCPYSSFRVGAALLDIEDNIFTGTNVENASYGLTQCAERAAFGTAISAGARRFKAIAIVTSGDTLSPPCGACRQVMSEFCSPDFVIVLASLNTPGTTETHTLGNLLPKTFSLKQTPTWMEPDQ